MSEAAESASAFPDPTAATEPEGPRPFSTFLAEQRNGGLLAELTTKLSDVVAGVVEYDKSGELTLKIKVKRGEGGNTVVVSDEVKAKVPEPDRPAVSLLPRQPGETSPAVIRARAELPLREVPKDSGSAPKEI